MQRAKYQFKISKNNYYSRLFQCYSIYLHRDPFSVADPKEALLLARFMVEENNQDVVNMDLEALQKDSIVKSVFRKIVGCYTLLDSAKDKRLWDEVTNVPNISILSYWLDNNKI